MRLSILPHRAAFVGPVGGPYTCRHCRCSVRDIPGVEQHRRYQDELRGFALALYAFAIAVTTVLSLW